MLKRKTSRYFQRFYSRLSNFDLNYVCSRENLEEIEQNITQRKGVGNIKLVCDLYDRYKLSNNGEKIDIENQLLSEILKIPNKTHPDVMKYSDGDPKKIKLIGEKKVFDFKPLEFQEITKRMNLVRTEQLGNYSGSKGYYLLGAMASLEKALVQYALKTLLTHNFELISVPDLIPKELVENCGLLTSGVRNQVFFLDKKLHKSALCLSGTSEMSLAGLFQNHVFEEAELPLKLAAVSRCYRAETSNLAEEKGLYRVHEFTKVEMFVIVTPEQSDSMLEYIRDIQEQHFSPLNLHMQVLDMPPYELGAPAYRKYDIEVWLPGRGTFGEISSCSNCTDYQSRRLGIKYRKNGEVKFVHTLNGTASAIPRLLIAITETGQMEKGIIEIPKVLHKYMYGQETIKKQTGIPQLKLIKSKK
ncbi:serine--tRNA ligase, mitochondrial [Coccinella septempunctata]|uniref:serine--tRNA ligase, mitochondrial n=1 Tax=Coccinella septempunctata TaxID=41139 RepID=UPI001D0887D6|nr:serine--tRNA ligase, mitochondrial [Coccinella septempunctata]